MFLIRFARFHQITEREGLSLSEAASLNLSLLCISWVSAVATAANNSLVPHLDVRKYPLVYN